MKILITTEFYLPFVCGVTTAVLNQRRALEERGHEVRILTIYEGKTTKFEDGVYYIKSNLPQFYKDSYATLDFNDPVLKDIYEWKPDIVHPQSEFFTMVFAKKVARKLNAPLILTAHTDYDAYGMHFMKNQNVWHKLTKTFVPKFIKSADRILCGTNKTYEILKSYGVKNRLEVIPLGLDLDQFKVDISSEERNKMRAEYSLTPEDLVLLSVCRLSEEKNVEESIQHFVSLHKERNDVRLLIVGDGTAREELAKQVSDLNLEEYIKFTGNIDMDTVWKYYQLGDIFISSSVSETLGLTYIEALASGLPIVCKRDHALDISLIDGINGYGFATDEEFLEAITPLCDDEKKRKTFSHNARESVSKFSIEKFGENLEKVYLEELELKSRRGE